MEPYRQSSLAYFGKPNALYSYTYNETAASDTMASLDPGDKVTVTKFPHRIELTVEEVATPENGASSIRFAGEIPEEILKQDNQEWQIAGTRRPFGIGKFRLGRQSAPKIVSLLGE